VGEPLRLDVERLILAQFRLGALDLLEHMPQVVGLPPHILLPRRQLGLARLQLFESRMGVAHGYALDVGVAVRIEHVALRVGTKQGLRLMLAMQVHEQRADLGEHPDGSRRAVHPGARLPFSQHFALQDETALL